MEKERERIKEKEKEFTVNFAELGRKFELTPGSIQAAIARACAEVRTCPVLTVVTSLRHPYSVLNCSVLPVLYHSFMFILI